MYIIYLITNNVNNKKYVGITKKSIEHRWIEHIRTVNKSKRYALHEAMIKYGVNNFSIEEIEKTENVLRESFWIKEYNTREYGYNLTDGGDGTLGHKFTKTQKKNISTRVKESHKNKIVGMYDKKHSEETKRKMSEAHKKLNRTKEKNPMYGKTHSEKTRNIISKKLTGRIVSEETRKKISDIGKRLFSEHNNPMYGKKHNDDSLSKMREKAKQREKIHCVVCNKTIDKSNYSRWHMNCTKDS